MKSNYAHPRVNAYAKGRTGDGMSFDEQNLGLGSWTRRKFVQMGAASVASLGVMKLAHAEGPDSHGSMMDGRGMD